MKRGLKSVMLCLLILSGLVQAGDLNSLVQKLPEDTFGFAATSGTSHFQSDFQNSIMGQIADDQKVKTFFEQILTSVSKSPDFEKAFGEGEDAIAFGKSLLASPTILAMVSTSDTLADEPSGVLLSDSITRDSDQGKLLLKILAGEMAAGRVVEKQMHGCTTFVSNDPNCSEPYYISLTGDCLLAAFNDTQYAILKNIVSSPANYDITYKLAEIPTSNDAFVLYFDFQKLMGVFSEEASSDPDAKQALEAFQTLGLADMQYYLFKAGFTGTNMTIDGKMKMSALSGIWNTLGPVDKGLFYFADPKAVQANAVYVSPVELYDTIMGLVSQIAQSEGTPVEPQISQFEEKLGFKLRDDLLTSLEGSFIGYMLPPYASPELLTGGYVVMAKLKNAETFKKCMLSIENLVGSMAPAGQLQISSQTIADGKEVHIWAVSIMAMMQIIPSWAVEGDTLIIASHPNVTKTMMQRVASGSSESLISKPEFANALNQIPADAFMMSLTDSKAQARQMMTMLQQYWPMLNMGLMQEGIQLPIMLPSIEPYIEQMQPGLSYTRQVADGIEFHYEGTGLEATTGSVAGGAMGAAILMPALSKTKKIARRVVCATNLKGLSTAMVVYCNDYDDMLPASNWCDLLIEEADVSPKSFVCPHSDAIEGESSYALNINIAGKKLGKLPPDTVLYFETDKGVEGTRSISVLTRRHHQVRDIYSEDLMVYKDRFNQVGGLDDVVCHHNNSGKVGCNIAFADGHTEFVDKERIADLRWTVD